MKLPYPLERHELFGMMMRVPVELEAEWAAARGLSSWQPIPEGKVLVAIGDQLELLPGHTRPAAGQGVPAADDGMIGIVGHEEISAFCEWYWGRLQ